MTTWNCSRYWPSFVAVAALTGLPQREHLIYIQESAFIPLRKHPIFSFGFTYIGSRQRVRARRGRVEERVALKVDVKGVAAVGVVAVLSACGGVVGLQEVIAHVAILLGGAVLVAEGRLVTLGRRCGEGEGAVGGVGFEAGVAAGWRTGTWGLR